MEDTVNRTGPILTRTAPAALLLLVTLAHPACSGDETSAGPDPVVRSTITLPLRVHVLASDEPTLNADLSDQELDGVLDGVNRIWEQAAVVWEVEGVFRENAVVTDQWIEMVEGRGAFSGETVAGVLPTTNRIAGAWDVYVVHDFGAVQAGGVYLGDGLTVSTLALGGNPVDLDDFATRVFAHELGHSLSLPHVPCNPPPGNLMAPGCPADDRTRLEPEQIDAARAQAETGRPYDPGMGT